MTETERELGLQLGEANAEIRRLKQELLDQEKEHEATLTTIAASLRTLKGYITEEK